MTLLKRENERVQERRETKAVAHERPGEWLKNAVLRARKCEKHSGRVPMRETAALRQRGRVRES